LAKFEEPPAAEEYRLPDVPLWQRQHGWSNMIDGPRRRRRLDDDGDGEGNGWLSMVALIVVVILVGLLLGAVLARVFGAKTTVVVSPAPLPTIVVTQEPSLTPLPTQSVAPSATPKISPSASPTALATATPLATASAAPTATPSATHVRPLPKRIVTPATAATPVVTPTAKPTVKPTVKPTLEPTATPRPRPKSIAPIHSGPQTSSDRAAAVVRLYLDALAHGRTAEARSYLASGEPTESSFMDASANVTSLRTTQNADGTFKVDADLNTSNGEYYITFAVQVSPGGAVIIDHTAIKP
jgi:cytoskeletal protein RodZ